MHACPFGCPVIMMLLYYLHVPGHPRTPSAARCRVKFSIVLQLMVVVHAAVPSSMCRAPLRWAAAREVYTLAGLIQQEVAELVHHSAILAQQAKVRKCVALSGWLALTGVWDRLHAVADITVQSGACQV